MRITDLLCRGGSFRRAVEASRPRLYRMAMAWCGQPDLADDLCQEALARALQKQHQLRSMDRLDAWMFAILANCWREHLRRRRPQVAFEEDLHGTATVSPEADRHRLDLIGRLRDEVMRLPEIQRQVLTLVDLEEFSYAEAAEILEVPIGTVMSRLHRARAQLRARMRDALGEDVQPLLREVK